jgi:hypothetical protein
MYLLPFLYNPSSSSICFERHHYSHLHIFTPASRQGAAPQELSRVAAFGCLQLTQYRGLLRALDDADLLYHTRRFGAIELYRTISKIHDNHLKHGHDVVLFPTFEVACISPRSQMAFSPPPGCKFGPSETFPCCNKMFARRYAIITD